PIDGGIRKIEVISRNNKVGVTLTTHDAGGVTQKDIDLATFAETVIAH
ncbi:hypothetical protein C9985_01380, partial [Marinobacter vinifirmus]